jgi:hypothetical protein
MQVGIKSIRVEKQVQRHVVVYLLELLRAVPRHAVPLLGGPEVQVADRVEVVVLVVPAEGGKQHADVQPRHVDAVDRRAQVLQQRALGGGDVVQIPARGGVEFLVEDRFRFHFRLLFHGDGRLAVILQKTAAIVHRVQIVAIVDGDLAVVGLDDVPVVASERLLAGRLGTAGGTVVLLAPAAVEGVRHDLVLRDGVLRAIVEALSLLQRVDLLALGGEPGRVVHGHLAGRLPLRRGDNLADTVWDHLIPDSVDK